MLRAAVKAVVFVVCLGRQFAEGNATPSVATPGEQETPRELSVLDCSNCTKLKSHAISCHDESFCFNEGSCYVIPTLGLRFCQCQLGFRGTRCAEKQAPSGEQRLKEEIGLRSAEFFFIVIGSVAGMLLLIAFVVFIIAAIYKRSSRTSRDSEKQISLLSETRTAVV